MTPRPLRHGRPTTSWRARLTQWRWARNLDRPLRPLGYHRLRNRR